MRNFGVNPAIRNMQNNTANYEVTQPATYAGVTWKTGVFALITIASCISVPYIVFTISGAISHVSCNGYGRMRNCAGYSWEYPFREIPTVPRRLA